MKNIVSPKTWKQVQTLIFDGQKNSTISKTEIYGVAVNVLTLLSRADVRINLCTWNFQKFTGKKRKWKESVERCFKKIGPVIIPLPQDTKKSTFGSNFYLYIDILSSKLGSSSPILPNFTYCVNSKNLKQQFLIKKWGFIFFH